MYLTKSTSPTLVISESMTWLKSIGDSIETPVLFSRKEMSSGSNGARISRYAGDSKYVLSYSGQTPLIPVDTCQTKMLTVSDKNYSKQTLKRLKNQTQSIVGSVWTATGCQSSLFDHLCSASGLKAAARTASAEATVRLSFPVQTCIWKRRNFADGSVIFGRFR